MKYVVVRPFTDDLNGARRIGDLIELDPARAAKFLKYRLVSYVVDETKVEEPIVEEVPVMLEEVEEPIVEEVKEIKKEEKKKEIKKKAPAKK